MGRHYTDRLRIVSPSRTPTTPSLRYYSTSSTECAQRPPIGGKAAHEGVVGGAIEYERQEELVLLRLPWKWRPINALVPGKQRRAQQGFDTICLVFLKENNIQSCIILFRENRLCCFMLRVLIDGKSERSTILLVRRQMLCIKLKYATLIR